MSPPREVAVDERVASAIVAWMLADELLTFNLGRAVTV
jgi:hypothetical protein